MNAQQNPVPPAAGAEKTAAEVTKWLMLKMGEVLEIDLGPEDMERSFQAFGLSSREELVLVGDLEDWLGYELAPTVIWDHPTIIGLATYIEELEARDPESQPSVGGEA